MQKFNDNDWKMRKNYLSDESDIYKTKKRKETFLLNFSEKIQE